MELLVIYAWSTLVLTAYYVGVYMIVKLVLNSGQRLKRAVGSSTRRVREHEAETTLVK